MKNLHIEWQRLLDDREQTCQRCGFTEQEVEKANRELEKSLKPFGISVQLVKKTLDHGRFKEDPLQSNKILINGRMLEEWLDAQTGQSPCCGPCGEVECRTIEFNEQTYETITADLIVNAGVRAALQMFGVKLPRQNRPEVLPIEIIKNSCCGE
jgi:hypothetical protein